MKLSLLLLTCLVAAPSLAQQSPPDTRAAKQQVQAVVNDFRDAIIQKDTKKFLGLFLREDVIWQSVHSDELLQKLRQKNPNANKVGINPKQNPRSFIEDIAAESKRSEEKFTHVRIDTDGTIASVSFEFTFNLDDRVVNRGQESWHLVNTGNGWKIVSVIWSNN
ncbi:nuclear transport factor 2 family protein [Myxococcaceae bacterium JPH2]|nr:nuclear transport factor 2 family protein [Myxococcaceae bacterium JPH2]